MWAIVISQSEDRISHTSLGFFSAYHLTELRDASPFAEALKGETGKAPFCAQYLNCKQRSFSSREGRLTIACVGLPFAGLLFLLTSVLGLRERP